MNEYQIPEYNIQNRCNKTVAATFKTKDYTLNLNTILLLLYLPLHAQDLKCRIILVPRTGKQDLENKIIIKKKN